MYYLSRSGAFGIISSGWGSCVGFGFGFDFTGAGVGFEVECFVTSFLAFFFESFCFFSFDADDATLVVFGTITLRWRRLPV